MSPLTFHHRFRSSVPPHCSPSVALTVHAAAFCVAFNQCKGRTGGRGGGGYGGRWGGGSALMSQIRHFKEHLVSFMDQRLTPVGHARGFEKTVLEATRKVFCFLSSLPPPPPPTPPHTHPTPTFFFFFCFVFVFRFVIGV